MFGAVRDYLENDSFSFLILFFLFQTNGVVILAQNRFDCLLLRLGCQSSLVIARKCTFWRLPKPPEQLRTCQLHPLGRCQAPRELPKYYKTWPIRTQDIDDLGSFGESHWHESDNGFVDLQKHNFFFLNLKTKPSTRAGPVYSIF